MRNAMAAVVKHGLVGAIMLFTTYGSAEAQERPMMPLAELNTSGTAERRAAPDRVMVHFSVETRAPSAAAAASANATAVQSVRSALRQARTDSLAPMLSYRVGPEYSRPRPTDEDQEPKIIGYLARTIVAARPPRIEDAGRAIDAALAAGATGVASLTFESSAVPETRNDAIAEAAVMARREAEVLARAMGGSLGPMIWSSTTGAPVMYQTANSSVMYRRMEGMDMVPSDIVVRVVVNARWRFIPSGQ